MGFGGIISSETKAKQSTKNNQVGIQGERNVGFSASSIGGKSTIVSGSGVAIAPINTKQGNVSINVTSPEAFEFASNIGIASLASQNNVSLAAINAANQLGINALGALRDTQAQAAASIDYAVGRSFDIAESAAPVSEAAASAMTSENTRKLLIGLGVVLVIGVGVYYLTQNN